MGCSISPKKVQESISQEVIGISESYGLSNVSVDVTDGKKFEGNQLFYMSVTSSNFEYLSYDQMFNLDNALDSVVYPDVLLVIGDYKSGEDTWSIFESGRSIDKNGSEIYNDFENSEIHKSVQENKDESYSNGTAVTDSNLKIDIWVCAQNVVEDNLKSPSSADFCSIVDASVYSNGNNNYTVIGYVDAENGFGAVIRNDFTVTLTFTGSGYKNGKSICP
jgi:hypothetical protein